MPTEVKVMELTWNKIEANRKDTKIVMKLHHSFRALSTKIISKNRCQNFKKINLYSEKKNIVKKNYFSEKNYSTKRCRPCPTFMVVDVHDL